MTVGHPWTTSRVAEVVGGVVRGDPVAVPVSGFAIDSRSLITGECFVALQGNRDGHDFVTDAIDAGAAAALVSRIPEDPALSPEAPLIVVDDPLVALGALAAQTRERLDPTVVGITGSVGKTGTKDLVAAVLSTSRIVHANPGSFNNESGLPLTILAAPADTEVLVLEMGARFAGNISRLAAIARPHVGVVTNIGAAHAAHFGTLEDVAAAKGELLEKLDPDGFAVLNADDPMTARLAQRTHVDVLTAGRSEAADVRISSIELDDELRPTLSLDSHWGVVRTTLPVRGAHQVANAALAATVGLRLGVTADDVATGLATARSARLRMDLRRSPSGVLVLDDSYNANPASMNAALDAFASVVVPGRRFAVLGSMLELGDRTDAEHAAIGDRLRTGGIAGVVVLGDEAAALAGAARRAGGVEVVEAADLDEAEATVSGWVSAGDAVLLKGSRALGLEVLAERLAPGDEATRPAPRPGTGASQ